jgi:type I restriction enzyme M protein
LDPTAGSGGFLLETLIQVWHSIEQRYAGRPDISRLKNDFALNHLFGIELHETAGRVCQTNLLLHQDGHTNVEVGRSCLDSSFSNSEIRLGRFSLVVGNPPFGDAVTEGDHDRLGTSRLSDFELATTGQADSEIVILERAIKFLEPGGRLGMVVPDGVLNNSTHVPLRKFLLENCRILAIVSLPDFAFRKAGAQNKTSLLFCRRFTRQEQAEFTQAYDREIRRLARQQDHLSEAEQEDAAFVAAVQETDYPVFLAEPDWIGYLPTGATAPRNELYSMVGARLDLTDATTLLGQYILFSENPTRYAGVEQPRCLAMPISEIMLAHPTRRMDPKYHLFKKREALASVPSGMRRFRLGDVLERRDEPVIPSDHPDEEFVGLTLTNQGQLLQREAAKGMNPIDWHGLYFKAGAKWFRARVGDLIVSRIDLWKGCVGIIPPQFDSAIVTNEFPLYRVREEVLLPYYLKLLLRTDYFRRALRAINTGHSNRRRTQDSDFEDLEIFLPDVSIQEQIVELVQRREGELQSGLSDYRRLISEVGRCVMGEISADDLLDSERRRDGSSVSGVPSNLAGDADQGAADAVEHALGIEAEESSMEEEVDDE